jgi:hypothetical protein
MRAALPPGTSGSEWDVEVSGTGLIHREKPNAAPVVAVSYSWTDGYEARVPVNWHQHNPYNYYVSRSRGAALMYGDTAHSIIPWKWIVCDPTMKVSV